MFYDYFQFKASLKTTFFVICSSSLKIDILFGFPHLDKATYNYPCVKTGVDKSKPT